MLRRRANFQVRLKFHIPHAPPPRIDTMIFFLSGPFSRERSREPKAVANCHVSRDWQTLIARKSKFPKA
ncbi:hypothetical protein CR492_16810 [Methylocella silvestris]|uniref:Uncharacterized protein n=1 Tax=Methylocella silvestris TaxID=199596 RepID=A0A2J7TDB2_METSI|nr:hypothetical protein CR492_16810 [Methylocella silvestris]